MNTDLASHDRLHEMVAPQQVPWWSFAPGFYWVLGALAVFAFALLLRSLIRRQKSRYHREALAGLARQKSALDHPPRRAVALSETAAHSKRAELTAYPRNKVATLTGPAWSAFLEDTVRTGTFAKRDAAALEYVPYDPRRAVAFGGAKAKELTSEVRYWLAHHRTSCLLGIGLLFGGACIVQAQVPPAAVSQFQDTIGSRVEAVTILGGDYGAGGGIYTFRGGTLADLSISKMGGAGAVAKPRPMGVGDLKWSPVLLGSVGHIEAENEFNKGYLHDNRMSYDIWAGQLGGGARFYLTDGLSLSPTISGIYGHTENEFRPKNAVGQSIEAATSGTFVNWDLDTWTVSPGIDARYEWIWRRTTFSLSSRFAFFHTESFQCSSDVVGVEGDSSTWENKLDVDVPLGLCVLGRELHSGGFFSRTDLHGGIADGLNEDHVYTANGRLVLDVLGKLWKVRWVGVGASYFWGDHANGWTTGLDMRLQF